MSLLSNVDKPHLNSSKKYLLILSRFDSSHLTDLTYQRSKTTGNLWQWWWTECSYGFSLSLSLVTFSSIYIFYVRRSEKKMLCLGYWRGVWKLYKDKSDQYLTLSKFSVGTAGIILQAPTLYDDRPAIDELLSEIEAAIYTKPQDFNGPPGLYDIVWTSK